MGGRKGTFSFFAFVFFRKQRLPGLTFQPRVREHLEALDEGEGLLRRHERVGLDAPAAPAASARRGDLHRRQGLPSTRGRGGGRGERVEEVSGARDELHLPQQQAGSLAQDGDATHALEGWKGAGNCIVLLSSGRVSVFPFRLKSKLKLLKFPSVNGRGHPRMNESTEASAFASAPRAPFASVAYLPGARPASW